LASEKGEIFSTQCQRLECRKEAETRTETKKKGKIGKKNPALNASGRGYYGQAKAGRAAKATHGTQVPS